MPTSKTLSRALAESSSSCSSPIVANTGLARCALADGVVPWAIAQIEQEADSVLFAWLWADSATAVHNIKDRQIHANHRKLRRICSCNGLDSFYLISVASNKAMPGKLLWS